MKHSKFFIGLISGTVLAITLTYATGVLPQINNAATAATPAVQTLSDEQLGIQAVRKAKAATVSVVGSIDYDPEAEDEAKIDATYGTGFIIDSNGYIVTNNHVIDDEDAVYTVITVDGTKYGARVLGVDKYNDLALLKIDAQNLPVITQGNSDALETGQTVFAIGNPLGKFQHSVSKGVVSGIGRTLNTGEGGPRLQNLIQTDAALNPGNSGGPLINLAGQVIGVDVARYDGQGLGFAIPINTVKDAVEQIKAFGKTSRPYLGISFLTIDTTIQTIKHLKQSAGALVTAVAANSPAARAGFKEDDIVVAVDRRLLSDRLEFDSLLATYKPGTQILITLIREGQQYDLPVIVGEYK